MNKKNRKFMRNILTCEGMYNIIKDEFLSAHYGRRLRLAILLQKTDAAQWYWERQVGAAAAPEQGGYAMKGSRAIVARGMGILLCGVLLAGCSTGLKGNQEDTQKGDTIVLDSLTLSIQGREIKQEVGPEQPEGYYDYYEPHEGYEYYVISGEAKNDSGQDIHTDQFAVEATVEAEPAQAKVVFLNEELSELTDVIEAGQTREFRMFMLKKVDQPLPESFSIYYNEDFRAPGKGSYDYKTTIPVEG